MGQGTMSINKILPMINSISRVSEEKTAEGVSGTSRTFNSNETLTIAEGHKLEGSRYANVVSMS